jgi:hypothetical protein
MSYARAFSGLTYTTRVPRGASPASAAPALLSRSSAHRNAASVFPDPVGAETKTCSPPAIAGHAFAWAGVGAAKACSNQSRTGALKLDRGTRVRLARPGCLAAS